MHNWMKTNKPYVEAKWGIMPDSILLRARLLSDGNFPDKALEVLAPHRINYNNNEALKLEYTYRLGKNLSTKSMLKML